MSYTTLIFSIFISILLIIAFIKVFSWIKRYMYTTKFQTYISILTYHMEKAYDIVHKDKILIFSIEATRPNEKDIDVAVKEFCRLTIKFLGPMLYRELKNLYGTDDVLLFIMVEYFNSQYESDEIRSASVDNLTSNKDQLDEA
jgi:hypothetical protein